LIGGGSSRLTDHRIPPQRQAPLVRRNTMTRKTFAYLIFIFVLIACRDPEVSIPAKYNSLPKIEYCDLPNYENKEAILTSKYEGMFEYWSLKPLNSCGQDLNVDFDTHDYYYKMPEHLKKRLNQNVKYFIVTAVGKYERNSNEGYGHLRHLKSRFIVSDLLDVKIVSD
jgi:hypothetical protein